MKYKAGDIAHYKRTNPHTLTHTHVHICMYVPLNMNEWKIVEAAQPQHQQHKLLTQQFHELKKNKKPKPQKKTPTTTTEDGKKDLWTRNLKGNKKLKLKQKLKIRNTSKCVLATRFPVFHFSTCSSCPQIVRGVLAKRRGVEWSVGVGSGRGWCLEWWEGGEFKLWINK